ncbi:BnaA08g31380D [Brassica napus]|uniref:(rape) hypothetical protein n=1 Tax=Brassica napus TaxID=3708 RepID=A0A078ILU8_BRANA|nr:unnamed protein product [Brassica napus]CDY52025.1 BnaA08g31380D [Brassica napus]
MGHISDIKLIRTDTTLDLSQKAEKGMICTNQRLVLMSTEQVLRGVQIYMGAEGIIHLTVYANAGGVNNTCLSPKKSYLTN